jgi:hypothetical protein
MQYPSTSWDNYGAVRVPAKGLMSALGQKRTLEHLRAMSALPPKADIAERDWNIRFVPKAEVSKCKRIWVLLAPLFYARQVLTVDS